MSVVHAGHAQESARCVDRLPLIAIACAVAIVAILTITPWPVGAFQDDAIYTVLAKSLAEGHGYKMLNLPGEPNATHFPPGYPLVLAAIWWLWPSFPDNVVAFKFLNAFLLAAGAVGAYVFMRRRFGSTPAAGAVYAIVGTLSVVVLLVTSVVMSEPMFMALLFPALLAGERAAESGTTRDAAVAGAWFGALSLVRTLGVFGIPALLWVLLRRRRWGAALAAGATAALFVVPWQLWVSANDGQVAPVLVGKYGAYASWAADGYREGGLAFARQVVARNLQSLDGMISYLLVPVQAAWPRGVALVGIGLLMLLGTKRFSRNAPVTLAFLAAYTLVVMLWPFEPTRFLFPVWPLWLPLIVGGVLLLWQSTRRPWLTYTLRTATAILVAGVALGFTWYNVMGYTKRWWVAIQRDAGVRAKPIVEWAAANTPPDAVLSTADDLVVYLYAGRKAVPTSTFTPREYVRPLTDAEDLASVLQIFDAYQPTHFIVASAQGMRTAATLANTAPPRARYIGRTPHVQIYQRVSP